MGQLTLNDPMLVARSEQTMLLVARAGLGDPMTPAQTWTPGDGYSDAKPLGVWLKFLYYLEEVNPPEKWVEPA